MSPPNKQQRTKYNNGWVVYTPHTADHRGQCKSASIFSINAVMNIINALQVNRTHVSVWQVLYGAMLEMEQNLSSLNWREGGEEGFLSTCATSHSTCIPRVVPQMGAQVRSESSHYTTLQTQTPLVEKLLLLLLWSCTDKVPIMALLDWMEPKGLEVVTRYSSIEHMRALTKLLLHTKQGCW